MRVRMLTDKETAVPCFIAVMVSDHDESPLFVSDPVEDEESALVSLYKNRWDDIKDERVRDAIEQWKTGKNGITPRPASDQSSEP